MKNLNVYFRGIGIRSSDGGGGVHLLLFWIYMEIQEARIRHKNRKSPCKVVRYMIVHPDIAQAVALTLSAKATLYS